MPSLRILPLFLAALAAWGGPVRPLAARSPLPPACQDPAIRQVPLEHLSGDQKKLADQARRLETLLEALEKRSREEGNPARADLLAGARQRLRNSGDVGDVISALERVAEDLNALRAGEALETQAELITSLQDLLDYLLERQRREQIDALRKAAAERRKILEGFAQTQSQLLDATGKLQSQENQAKKPDARSRQDLARSQEALSEKIAELGKKREGGEPEAGAMKKAAEAGRQAAQAIDPKEAGKPAPAEPGKAAAGEKPGEPEPPSSKPSPAKPSPEKPSPDKPSSSDRTPSKTDPQARVDAPLQPGQNLDRAQEQQKKALEALRQAARQASREEKQLQGMERREQLINVMLEASALLERHRKVMDPLKGFAAQNDDPRPPRSARVQLRQWSGEEQEIASAADSLRDKIQAGGADSVPFLLQALKEDHKRLAEAIGPPEYRTGDSQMALGDQITQGWEELIEALRTEAERQRQKIQTEGKEQDKGKKKNQPLVSFASELQLLKKMEEGLRNRMERLEQRREILQQAGVPLDSFDVEEIEQIVDRQGRLRILFEAILERLREAQQESDSEDEV